MIDNTKPYGFMAANNDLNLVLQIIMDDEKLCKALYYNGKDALKQPNLTAEQKEEIIEKAMIGTTPKIPVTEDNEVRNAIYISLDHFTPNATNSQYLDSVLSFDILCHVDNYKINDRYNRTYDRPYYIAHLIHEAIIKQKLSGIGRPELLAGKSIVLTTNPDYAGIGISFNVINSANEYF